MKSQINEHEQELQKMSLEKIKKAAEDFAEKSPAANTEASKEISTSVIDSADTLTALAIFGKEEGVQPLIEKIRNEALSMVPDLGTVKGRKEIASMAYKVSKSKTALDTVGKNFVAGKKKEIKLIDDERKLIRDSLDALRDEVRDPLNKWEAEQAEIEAAKVAAEEAEKLRQEIESGHEIGLMMNELHDKRVAEEVAEKEAEEKRIAEDAKKAQELRDKQIAEAAAEQVRQEAKEAAEIAERARKEAIEAAAEAKAREKIASEKAEADKIAAAEKAEADKVAAIQAEKDRVAAEQKAEAEALAAREADKAHYKKIMSDAKADMLRLGIGEADAINLLKAIKRGWIAHVSIKF